MSDEAKRDTPRGAVVKVDPRHPHLDHNERLRFVEKVGEGGISEIRRVLQTNLMRDAAMKVLHEELADEETSLGRLIEEAQITAQLDHPGIVPVHELGVDDEGNLYFTMKLVEGMTLTELLKRQDFGRRTAAELFQQLQVFVRVCEAVAFAHSRGVVHRDLKPDNIMVGEYGEVFVMDWGIARLTSRRPSKRDLAMPETESLRYEVGSEDGLVIGTPGFMAPEQARGDIAAIDERTDIFSLGAILYAILTQAPPYFGRTSREMVVNTLTSDVIPPHDRVHLDLPVELSRIAMRALDRDPEKRYADALQLKDDVERFMQSGWQLGRRCYAPGELIVREGDEGHDAFIITAGRCQAFKTVDGTEMSLREMGEGDVFGETAVLTDSIRTASVRAIDDVELMVVDRSILQEELGSGAFVGRFVRALAERFREKDGRATELEVDKMRGQLESSILKYLNFSGTAVGDHRREASWSTLLEVLTSYFQRPAEEVAEMVRRLGAFTVDEERDVIVLERVG